MQIVLSLTPALLSKQSLHSRIASAAHVLVLDNLSKIELISICAIALKNLSAGSGNSPVELCTDEGRKKVAQTIVELSFEADLGNFVRMSSNDVVAWAKSLYRHDFENTGLLSCLEQETNRRIVNKIMFSQLRSRYIEFTRILMKKEWSATIDSNRNRVGLFQSIASKFEKSSSIDCNICSMSPER